MRPKAWVLMLLQLSKFPLMNSNNGHHRTCCTEMPHTQPTSQLIAKFSCCDITQSKTWLYFATMEEGKIFSKTGLESERLNETWSVMFPSSQVKSCLARVTVGWSTTTEAWLNSTTQWETTRRCLNTTTYCPTGTGWGTGSLQWRMPWRTSTLHPSRPRRWYKLSYWPRA